MVNSSEQSAGSSHDLVQKVQELQRLNHELEQRLEASTIALQHTTANLTAIQRVAHIGDWEFDVFTQTITWSEELFQIYGFDPAQPEPTYPQHIQLVHPDDRPLFEQAVNRAICYGEAYDIDFRSVRPDGSLRYIHGRGEAVLDDRGQVVRLFGTAQDITDRKQLEYALRQQAEREHLLAMVVQRIRHSLNLPEILNATVQEVRQLLHTDRVLIYQFAQFGLGDAGRVVVESVGMGWSPTLNQVLPDPCLKEIYGTQDLFDQVRATSDLSAPDVNPCYAAMLAPFQVQALLDAPIVQGNRLWGLLIVHQCATTRSWEPGEMTLLQQVADQVGIAIQQSELYQQVQHLNTNLEQKIQNRTAQLEAAFFYEATLKRISDAVRDSLDETQILQTVVRELAVTLQVKGCDTALYSSDYSTATIYCDYTVPPLRSAQGMTVATKEIDVHCQLVRGESVQFCILPAYPNPARPDIVQYAVLACPIVDDQAVLGNLWLIRNCKQVFDELELRLVMQVANQCGIALRQARIHKAVQTQIAELERLNRLKDDFLSAVSHELRSPMSNIKMATQMLEICLAQSGALGDSTNPVNQYFHILKDECQREISLINDLLDLARLDAESELPPLTWIELSHWLSHLAEPFQERARNQQQSLVLEIPPHLPLCQTEPSYLSRVVTELLHNACKYTPAAETIVLSARFVLEEPILETMATTAALPVLYIAVSNTGIEIPEQERDRVFEKFYRIPNNDPWRHGGTGLGLALVKRLVQRLGGGIQLESAAGSTKFAVWLPVAVDTSSSN